MATTTSPNDLTRQQLDELDTLLQRMLALPLNKPEIPHPPTVAPPPPLPDMPPINGMWRTDSAQTEVKTPYFAAQPEPAMTLSHAVTPSGLTRPGPSAFAVVPPPGTGTLRGVDAPATPAGFVPMKLPSVSAPAPAFGDVNPFLLPPPGSTSSVATKAVPAKTSTVPVVMWPVYGVNTILEFFLKLLGPIGTVLLKPSMKMVLGFAGLALLAGAGAWAAMGMGWVQWPQ
jgi:hypothetical protein